MKYVPTVAYIHSKICDAIITAADSSGEVPLVGVIYGRGYRGFSNKNPIYTDSANDKRNFYTIFY